MEFIGGAQSRTAERMPECPRSPWFHAIGSEGNDARHKEYGNEANDRYDDDGSGHNRDWRRCAGIGRPSWIEGGQWCEDHLTLTLTLAGAEPTASLSPCAPRRLRGGSRALSGSGAAARDAPADRISGHSGSCAQRGIVGEQG